MNGFCLYQEKMCVYCPHMSSPVTFYLPLSSHIPCTSPSLPAEPSCKTHHASLDHQQWPSRASTRSASNHLEAMAGVSMVTMVTMARFLLD